MDEIKILVVDDLLGYRLFIRQIIEDLGYKCLIAKNGQQALDLLAKNTDLNLIFLDIEMPVLNGYDTALRIRNNFAAPFCNIPIIVLTSHSENFLSEKYSAFKFTDILSKDTTPEEVSQKIFKHLKKYK